jgi:hypothetical protein
MNTSLGKIKKNIIPIILIIFVCILIYLIYKNLSNESFVSNSDKGKVNNILSNEGLSFYDKISQIKKLNINDSVITNLIMNNDIRILNFINDKLSDSSFFSKSDKEYLNGILTNGGLSSFQKISKIKELNIKNDIVNNTMFENEKKTLELIKTYITNYS